MRNMLYALLLALFFLACVFFFPRFAFGQEVGIRFSLVRFSTGGGQKMETIFSGRSHTKKARDWSWERSVLQLKGNLLIAADWAQTREATRHPEKSESNIVLGKHPSAKEVDLYMGVSMLVYNMGTAVLLFLDSPQPYLDAWQGGWIMVEVHCVDTNYHEEGLKF